MCEVVEAGCRLKDLSTVAHAGESAGVLGAMIGSSTDGSYVYFVANSVLSNQGIPVAGATPGSCKPELGGLHSAEVCNLYVSHDGVVSLVAGLSATDFPDWEAGGPHDRLGELTARVSPNGRFLAFMSQRSLTGYDNHDAVSGVPDEEVFLFDAASGRVVCASCNPTGARPHGILDPKEQNDPALLVDRPFAWSRQWLAASIPGWTGESQQVALYQSRYLSDEGRLFFDSRDGLVSRDGNGKEDVYEFEPEGLGGCSSATSSGSTVFVREDAGSPVDGCVGLISSGGSSEESAFLDASGKGPGGSEGEDVFFLTTAKLSTADVDSALDVYDAHVCSGVSPCPAGSASVPPACTTADSCRVGPAPQPGVFGAPASATFSGAGNLAPAPPVGLTAAQIRAAHLAKALKACRKRYPRSKKRRSACEHHARVTYAPAHQAKKPSKAGH